MSKNVTLEISCEKAHSSSMVLNLVQEYNAFAQSQKPTMNNLSSLAPLLSTSLALLLVLVGYAFSANNSISSDADLEPILRLIDGGEYLGAIEQLNVELSNDPGNPDILSLLGFSYRKVLNFEDALMFFQSALRVEPEHRAANKYLGEFYLETDQFDKAQTQLGLLDSLSLFTSSEYAQLKKSIEQYQRQTDKL